MDVSIIIVNYNTQDLTLQCLRSVYEKTTGLLFEVIVVDNASSDDSVKQIGLEFPQAKLIKSTENLGFGRANNLGYEHSTGDYIFLLNSDTILINNAIEILWQFLNEHVDFAIVGGQLFEKDGLRTTHSYSYVFPSLLMELDILLRGRITRRIENKKLKFIAMDGFVTVAYITGADMMLRRCDIQQYRFFNPRFFLYFEETELSYRYHRNGRISVFLPTAKIIHLAGGSFSLEKARSKFYVEGRRNYYKITHSILYHKMANFIWQITYITEVIRNATHRSKRKEWMGRIRLLISRDSNH
jgi:GT2 family glycosyltransferase